MSKTQIVTLRVPIELKARLEHEAEHQGVSLNNLANYFLTTQLSQVEAISMIDERISKKNISKLKSKVRNMLNAVPNNKEVPNWDAVK
ncbi:MAG: type II toxin-antitoxin system HicB family antitoxin [Candidatus Thiosymbion ectosymbiont of Robbea hypermnestra]|nr:type II toxin-antitoxin system HicB family antitoxin [Candidatus Thiosymbion ectosymbiont of Robbea hypermnestra]